MEFDPGTLSLNYDGLQLKRRFYSPTYHTQGTMDRMPDQRYLLHWQPDVMTDDQGKRQIEFYTSDVEGNYVIVVEGLDAFGHAGSKHHFFSVKSADSP
jgi:hypothetical protein